MFVVVTRSGSTVYVHARSEKKLKNRRSSNDELFDSPQFCLPVQFSIEMHGRDSL